MSSFARVSTNSICGFEQEVLSWLNKNPRSRIKNFIFRAVGNPADYAFIGIIEFEEDEIEVSYDFHVFIDSKDIEQGKMTRWLKGRHAIMDFDTLGDSIGSVREYYGIFARNI